MCQYANDLFAPPRRSKTKIVFSIPTRQMNTKHVIKTIHRKQEMTLKGSNFHTKNTFTLNHNPVGVEFFLKNYVGAGHALRLRRF